ncbi:MAG: folate-binding protein YgfZ [Hyphomicrobiales bacterium]
MTVSAVRLTNRALVHVGGADAETFLQGLITFDMERLKQHASGFGALLTPQGKLLFDFFVVPMDNGFLLDTLADAGPDLVKRLSMYKLRADVSVSDITEDVTVLALLPSADGGDLPAVPGTMVVDPRHVGLGHRAYVPNAAIGAALADAALVIDEMDSYLAKRIELGVPEAPLDYTYGEVFPHDINLDQINAVGFEKGCFVGQEVVSRMKHRGTARRRVVLVSSTEELPETGTEITVEKKIVGTLGSVSTHIGLAAVRIDRVNDAMEEGTFIKAGSVQVTLAIPDWVSFRWV